MWNRLKYQLEWIKVTDLGKFVYSAAGSFILTYLYQVCDNTFGDIMFWLAIPFLTCLLFITGKMFYYAGKNTIKDIQENIKNNKNEK